MLNLTIIPHNGPVSEAFALYWFWCPQAGCQEEYCAIGWSPLFPGPFTSSPTFLIIYLRFSSGSVSINQYVGDLNTL